MPTPPLREILGLAKAMIEHHLSDGDCLGAGARRLWDLIAEHYPDTEEADLDSYVEGDEEIQHRRAEAEKIRRYHESTRLRRHA